MAFSPSRFSWMVAAMALLAMAYEPAYGWLCYHLYATNIYAQCSANGTPGCPTPTLTSSEPQGGPCHTWAVLPDKNANYIMATSPQTGEYDLCTSVATPDCLYLWQCDWQKTGDNEWACNYPWRFYIDPAPNAVVATSNPPTTCP